MPLRQDFGAFRRPVDVVSPLQKALSNVQQTFSQMEATELKKAQQAEDKRRYDEGMLLRQAAEKRAAGEYQRGLDERKATDEYLKLLSQAPQERGGWINPVTEKEKAFVDQAGFFEKVDEQGNIVYTDVEGLPITQEEAKRRSSMQQDLGSIAGTTPSQQETKADRLRRVIGQVQRSGGLVTPAMRKDLLTAEAAELEASKLRAKGVETEKAALAKEIRGLELDAAKFRSGKLSKTGKDGSIDSSVSGATKLMDFIDKEIPNTDWGANALGGKDLKAEVENYVLEQGVNPGIVKYALKRLKEGENDAWFSKDAEVSKKALFDTINKIHSNPKLVNKVTDRRYDTTYETMAGKQADILRDQLTLKNEELAKLGLTPAERQDLSAREILAGVREPYETAAVASTPVLEPTKEEVPTTPEVEAVEERKPAVTEKEVTKNLRTDIKDNKETVKKANEKLNRLYEKDPNTSVIHKTADWIAKFFTGENNAPTFTGKTKLAGYNYLVESGVLSRQEPKEVQIEKMGNFLNNPNASEESKEVIASLYHDERVKTDPEYRELVGDAQLMAALNGVMSAVSFATMLGGALKYSAIKQIAKDKRALDKMVKEAAELKKSNLSGAEAVKRHRDWINNYRAKGRFQ